MAVKSNKHETITVGGRNFIAKALSVAAYNGFEGAMGWDQKDGGIKKNEIVSANIKDHLGNTITTNDQYFNAIVYWYELYGQKYNINPNILAAQGYVESTFRSYAYAQTSTAMGIGQFTIDTIHDVIFGNLMAEFTNSEINTLTNGIVSYNTNVPVTNLKNYYIVKDAPPTQSNSTKTQAELSLNNKLILYHNVVNNPQIMIKAQAVLLAAISKNHNNLAASTLMMYHNGPFLKYPSGDSNLKSTNFGELFDKVLKLRNKYGKDVYNADVINRGLDYVRRILDMLAKDGGTRLGGSIENFGFVIDRTEIKGSALVDASLSHNLRTQPSEIAGTQD